MIGTNSSLTKSVEVDYVFIHGGERYDFLLKPKTEPEANGTSTYLMLAQSIKVFSNENVHIAEALLQYGSTSENPTTCMQV